MTGVTPAELVRHAFLHGLPASQVAPLARASKPVTISKGQRIFEEGTPATEFWLIKRGQVALDVHLPGRRRMIMETLGDGDLLGLSWISPPLPWQFGAAADTDTTAYQLDGAAVLAACDQDPQLGYQLLRRAMATASRRLQATRIRLLDLYAVPGRDSDRS
jgi:CRP/FNR family transcriptional regulator, cyclic AMP receptor protein